MKKIITMAIAFVIMFSMMATSLAAQAAPTYYEPAEVFVNGNRFLNTGVYMNVGGEPMIDSHRAVYHLFPEETRGYTFPDSDHPTRLSSFADMFGYKMVTDGNLVYLNNDGVKPLQVYLNGDMVNFPDRQGIIRDNRTLVPVRTISEMMKCDVFWDNSQREVQIHKDQKFIFLKIGENTYRTNHNTVVKMDCAAIIENNRTMVPLRFIAEEMGLFVGFEAGEEINKVILKTTI